MKRIYLAVLVAIACAACSSVDAQEESTWFDLHNCAICKNMADIEDLLPNIKWENHKLPNGMLSISVVPDAYKEKMEKAHKGMEATIEKLEGGEAMDLCGFCTSYGMLMASGAESTELKTVGGDISLLTSDDPEVVKKIHTHADKTIEEFKKMMAHGHHGEHRHDHGHEKAHKTGG